MMRVMAMPRAYCDCVARGTAADLQQKNRKTGQRQGKPGKTEGHALANHSECADARASHQTGCRCGGRGLRTMCPQNRTAKWADRSAAWPKQSANNGSPFSHLHCSHCQKERSINKFDQDHERSVSKGFEGYVEIHPKQACKCMPGCRKNAFGENGRTGHKKGAEQRSAPRPVRQGIDN